MKVRDVMTAEVHTASADTPYKELVERMLKDQVSGMPIVAGDGYVAGMVTEADLIRKLAFSGDHHVVLSYLSRMLTGEEAPSVLRVEGVSAWEIMTQPVISVGPDDDVGHAARVMLSHHVKRLPVVVDGRLVGMVVGRDLMRVFDVPDGDIAAAVERSLRDPLIAPDDHQVTASVEEGVVTLTGTVLHRSDVAIVLSLARAVAGVVAVRSEVTERELEPRLDNLDVPLAS